jgi:plasmid maintenance system antidote protein VapI
MANNIKPAQVFPLADYLRQEMAERGMLVSDIADRSHLPMGRIHDILAGATIGRHDADALAEVFGVKAELFLNLQADHFRYHRKETD